MRGHIRKRNESWQITIHMGTELDGEGKRKPLRHFETIHGHKGDAQRH